MIDLGFNTSHLYAALRLTVSFGLRDGTTVQGSGTGFFVKRPTGALFLVTARHVLDPRLAVPKHPGAIHLSTRVDGWNFDPNVEEMTSIAVNFTTAPYYHPDSAIDIAVHALDPPLEWNGVPVTSYLKLEDCATKAEYDNGDVRAGDFLAAPGFAPIPAFETERPVLLTGVIASDPRVLTLVHRSESDVQAVIYQSLSRAGLSGAPVFATQRGLILGEGLKGPAHRPMRLVGVNAGGFKDSSGGPLQFSYFSRSDALLELITHNTKLP